MLSISLIIVACLVTALLIGLVANRWVRPFAKSEVQGVKLETLDRGPASRSGAPHGPHDHFYEVRRRVQLGAVSALALMLVLVQLTIADIDRPYDGLIAVEPVDIERVADDLSEDYPTRPLPCDPSGNEV